MRTPRPSSFERAFKAGDELLFQELVEGMIGAECTRCHETYADGMVLDIGKLITVPALHEERPAKQQGEWVVASWGCDIDLADPIGVVSAQSEEDFPTVMALAERLVGARVANIAVHPPELSLIVGFSNHFRLTFRTDAATADLDQWYIQLPTAFGLAANGRGEWSLMKDSRASREEDI